MALAKKFKTKTFFNNIRDKIHNLRQGKESVGEFARKIVAKTKVAFQDEDKNIRRMPTIDYFYKRLRPEIRRANRRMRMISNL